MKDIIDNEIHENNFERKEINEDLDNSKKEFAKSLVEGKINFKPTAKIIKPKIIKRRKNYIKIFFDKLFKVL